MAHPPPATHHPLPTTYHDRADLAVQAHLLAFWRGDEQYLRAAVPDSGDLTGYWSYAQALHLLADNVARTRGAHYAGLLESLFLGQAARGWPRFYYDDESWMGLALLRAYDVTHDSRNLAQAIYLFNHIRMQWDTTCCGGRPGGIWWDFSHTQKATASNAGPTLLGAQIYQRTGDNDALAFARQVYAYWLETMVDPVTYHVFDHITAEGTRVDWQFTYNEGLMIGAAVELYQATGDPLYLEQAHRFARYLVAFQTVPTAYGPVLSDGSNETCRGDCEQFKGVAYRYLAQLYRLDTGHAEYYAVLKASAEAVWNLARNADTTTFATDWAGPPLPTASHYRNSSAVTALTLLADLEEPYPGCADCPPYRYEAEDATIQHVALEALYPGFTGWGYVAAWMGDGQQVDFHVTLPADGVYHLTFRYAAGAGEARRLLRIDGYDSAPGFTFAATGGWDQYADHGLTGYFTAGLHTISLVFDSASGSTNFLNLDNLTITDNRVFLPLLLNNADLRHDLPKEQ